MRVLIAIVLTLTAVAAVPRNPERIVGGSVTTIGNYPEIAALLYSWGITGHRQTCGGVVITNRSILTAAHCIYGDAPGQWLSRVGSTNAHSGGSVLNSVLLISHTNYNIYSRDNDIGIIHVNPAISFTGTVQPGSISGPNYFLADNQAVYAAGWGSLHYGGPPSEQLRHVQIMTVNQNLCRARFADLGYIISDNMLCAGWIDVGGRDKCYGDNGGPIYHNRVVVGISSWTVGCADPRFPGVSTRVSSYTPWIQANAW